MGLFRFVLATSIIIHHSFPLFGYSLLGREITLRSFYLISGFYMALVLHEKYNKKNFYFLFITNRLLRLFPIYWIVLFLTIVLQQLFFYYGLNPGSMQYYIDLSRHHQTQSILFFYAPLWDILRDITLLLRTDYLQINTNYRNYFLMGQMYTLVLELLFYVIAPFIVKRSVWFILFLSAISLFLRHYTFKILFVNNEPIGEWFFPVVLIYFLMGVLSYRLYKLIKGKELFKKYTQKIFLVFFFITAIYSFIPFGFGFRGEEVKSFIYLFLLMCAIPFLFNRSFLSKIGKFLGDLSYPMYISHTLVFLVLANSKIIPVNTTAFTIVLIMSTVLFSMLLLIFVDKPINAIRQTRLLPAKKKRKS